MSYGTGRPSGAVRVIAGAVVGVIVSGAILVGSAVPADAHTALESSSPQDGGTIDVAPSEIVMEFSEPVLTVGSLVVVLGPSGADYQAGAAQLAGDKLTQPLKPLDAPGEYRVGFRVVADDGHPLTGEIHFTLTKPGPAAGGAQALTRPPSLAPVSNAVHDAPPWESQAVGMLTVLLVLGAVLFGWRVTRGLDNS